MGIASLVNNLNERLKLMEARLQEMTYNVKAAVQTEFKSKFGIQSQSESMYGMYTALCVDTIDPWKQNRVRFYSPLLHDPNTPILGLPWANAVSSMGGFDDSGCNWVPPAGSTLCLVFENGSRSSPFYLGTTWHRSRGKTANARDFGYNIKEFYDVYEGSRDGYLIGDNTGAQVLPPWNTESYNGPDVTSIVDFFTNPAVQQNITVPNIYGFKTNGKHMLKMVDGDPFCNYRSKRLELMSGNGNWMMFKDDHLHAGGTWAHPSCGVSGPSLEACHGDESGILTNFPTVESTECDGEQSNSTILGGKPSTSERNSNSGTNPFFKHQSECRPYKGPETPLNPKIDLPQSGIQIMSISGHTIVADDSVNEPQGVPNWKRGTQAFDYGCDDTYKGRFYIKSSTGHLILLNDVESQSKLRGQGNGIQLLTASGNRIQMDDHTVGQKGVGACPPNIAGRFRGITLESTSRHSILMRDPGNEQCSATRKDGGEPISKAKDGFIRLRTGYGLKIMMKDSKGQEDTDRQYIQIEAPQKDNQVRGPHIFRMQERPSGPGQIMLRAGGDYIIETYDDLVEEVGNKDINPSNKLVNVSNKYVVNVEDVYYNRADRHVFWAQQHILLFAGDDCPPPGGDPGDTGSPCLYPVVVGKCPTPCPLFPWITHWTEKALSDKVFASAGPPDDC